MPDLPKDIVILETPRLYLRALTPECYKELFSSWDEERIASFLGDNWEVEREKHQQGNITFQTSFVNFQMLLKENGQLIGACGYHTWYLRHRRAEIGYALTDETQKRKGLMKEALQPILHYGFASMQLNRIEAMVGPDNAASRKLVQYFGFTEEGRLRAHYIKDGDIQDSIVYGLLRNEFDF